jgi:glyoxylase I family protein
VTDPVRSRPLYDLVLTHAGFTSKGHDVDWAGWGLGDKRYPCITILQARGLNAGRPHDRYAPGLHHFALRAKSPADVDALFAKLASFGADILDPPRFYPDYGEGYYALFFADPDGLKIEYVHTTDAAEMRRPQA